MPHCDDSHKLCSFLWTIFQLQLLCQSSSPVHRSLDDLPKSLDETYDCILKGIAWERQEYAQLLFQCLAVSFRPLRADELANIHTIHFRTEAHPRYIMDWSPNDSERMILSICPSLITVIDMDGSRVVQFRHSSIKRYLKSGCLASAEEPLSQYHVLPRSAHTMLAQVSLNVLLAMGDRVDMIMVDLPLVTYAAQYWIKHTHFGYISLRVKYLMERLFDPSKPYFSTWLWIYDIDLPFRKSMSTPSPTPPEAVPLYYAVLCGFRGLVEHLIITCPEDINAMGGYHGTPLHAAIAEENVGLTTLLLEHGADVASLNNRRLNPLHEASRRGNIDLIELLHKYHVLRSHLGAANQANATHLEVLRV
jgi:hypothetical protein